MCRQVGIADNMEETKDVIQNWLAMAKGKTRNSPLRSPREFWDKTYLEVLSCTRKRFKSKKRAEQYARGTSGQICHHPIGKSRKAYNQKKAAKRKTRKASIYSDVMVMCKNCRYSAGETEFWQADSDSVTCPQCGSTEVVDVDENLAEVWNADT